MMENSKTFGGYYAMLKTKCSRKNHHLRRRCDMYKVYQTENGNSRSDLLTQSHDTVLANRVAPSVIHRNTLLNRLFNTIALHGVRLALESGREPKIVLATRHENDA